MKRIISTLAVSVIVTSIALVSANAQTGPLVPGQTYNLGGVTYKAVQQGTQVVLVQDGGEHRPGTPITSVTPSPVAPVAQPVTPAPVTTAPPAVTPAPATPAVTPAPAAAPVAQGTHVLGGFYPHGKQNYRCVSVQTVQSQEQGSMAWSNVRTIGGNTVIGGLTGGFGTSGSTLQKVGVHSGGSLLTTLNTDARTREIVRHENGTDGKTVTKLFVVAEGPSTPVNLGQQYGNGFIQLVPCDKNGVIKKNKDGSVKI